MVQRNGPAAGTLASALTAVLSVLAALSCCLPLAPFLLAGGFAGASALFASLRPYLIAFAVVMLAIGFIQAFRARQCTRQRRALNVAVLLASTGLVAVMLFAQVSLSAPGANSGVAAFDLATFRQSFNADAGHTRLLVLLSPT